MSTLVNVVSSAVTYVTSLSLSTVLLTALLLYFVMWYFSSENVEVRKLPGPKPMLPIVGSTYLFTSDVSNILHDMLYYAKKFRHFYHVRFGAEYIIVNSPEAVGVFMSSSEHLAKNQAYDTTLPWLGTGLLTSSDSKWFKRRKMLTPAFHFNILDQFVDVFNEQASVLAEKIRENNGDKVDIFPYVTKAALDVICEAVMGVSIGAQQGEGTEYMKAIDDMNYVIFMRFLKPWLTNEFIFSWSYLYRKQERALKFIHDFANSVIRKRREEMAEAATEEPGDSNRRPTFMDLLLTSTIDGQPLSDADVREEVDTFMFAGHDTTSSAASWILYNLGRFPDVQARAFAEVHDVLGDDLSAPITREHLTQLHYLEMVIKETLRLFPSVPIIGRRIVSDVSLQGHRIPARSMIALLIYAVHRDPDHWPDPERFDPERFNPENSRGRHPYAYVPFSAGPRNCIGQKFAMMEEKVLIARLLHEFRITAIDKLEDLKVTGDIVLRLDGPLWLTFTPRE